MDNSPLKILLISGDPEMARRVTELLPAAAHEAEVTTEPTAGAGLAMVATNHEIDLATGLITVWMVQHAGFPKDGKEAHEAYKNAGKARFAPA